MARGRGRGGAERDHGLVGSVNLLLALGLVASSLGAVATVWEPEMLRRAEDTHVRRAEAQLVDFAAAIDALALGGRVNSTSRMVVDLGGEARGMLTSSRTYGTATLGPWPGGTPGLQVNASMRQAVAGQHHEGTLVAESPDARRILAGGDRGDPSSLGEFELRITDVAKLVEQGQQGSFRVAVLRAGVCSDPTCPQLQLSPEQRGRGGDYRDKVLWIAAFYKTKANGLDAISVTVWPHGGAATTSWISNPDNAANAETINLLCDEHTARAPCPSQRPLTVLREDLQLWPVLFANGAGVPGEQYDVWLVNGHRAYGTYRASGTPSSPGSAPGSYALPLPGQGQVLEVDVRPAHTAERTLRMEHGALVAVQGERGVMLAPPPFVFRRAAPDVVEATLRVNVLTGLPASTASSQGAILEASLERQLPVEGIAGELTLRVPTATCVAWMDWFRGAMSAAGLAQGAGFAARCEAPGVAVLTVRGPSADPATPDLRVSMLGSALRVGVGS